MSFTKTKIYNLAFSALLLARQISNVDSDTTTNEVRILNQFYDDALSQTLTDMDLDCLSEEVTLELLENLNDGGPWAFVYKYPTRCAFLRRIKSCAIIDNAATAISKRVGIHNGQKAIFTNQDLAVAEIIPSDAPLAAFPPSAGWAVAYHLAFLAAPLLTGKGAKALAESVWQRYNLAVTSAQEQDKLENFNYDSAYERSEFVRVRLS